MAADVRLFFDEDCTHEVLNADSKDYMVYLCNGKPLDGNKGEKLIFKMFLKNQGDRAALNTQIFKEQSDDTTNDNLVYVRALKILPKDNILFIGDIKKNEVVPIYFCINVVKRTPVQYVLNLFKYEFHTLPDVDVLCYNPYTHTMCSVCEMYGRYYVTDTGEDVTANVARGDFYVKIDGKMVVLTKTNFKIAST